MERPYTLSPAAPSSVRTRRKVTLLQNFSRLPQAFRMVREQSSDRVMEATWNHSNIGHISWHPQSNWMASTHWLGTVEKKSYLFILGCAYNERNWSTESQWQMNTWGRCQMWQPGVFPRWGNNTDVNWAVKIVWVIILSVRVCRHVCDHKMVLSVLSCKTKEQA